MFSRTFVILLVASCLCSVALVEWKGKDWEPLVRSALYQLKSDSIPVYSTEYTDEKGIPYVDYATLNGITAGIQYNPTIVCNYAIDYYNNFNNTHNPESRQKFFHCVNWLAQNLVIENNYALFVFNWQQPWYDSVGVPFTSGMTSGLAIQVFTHAYRLAGDAAYLDLAAALTRGFYIPIDSGGFTYMSDDGWWFEELADTSMHTPFILDGHIFSITGLHEYWRLTRKDSALHVINRGVASLINKLPSYDIGNGWSYYDKYRKPSDLKYHTLLTAQMKQLFTITGNDVFNHYYLKWRKPLNRWYVQQVMEDRNISGIVLFLLVWSIVTLWFAVVVKIRNSVRPDS